MWNFQSGSKDWPTRTVIFQVWAVLASFNAVGVVKYVIILHFWDVKSKLAAILFEFDDFLT